VIRVALITVFAAAILAAVFHVSVWIFFVPIAAWFVYSYTVGGLRTRCPSCRKRVKIGAAACHHCGRDVRPAKGGA
jgi:hypothetical protein